MPKIDTERPRIHVAGPDSFHPYECRGPRKCVHCRRLKNKRHEPRTCWLCHDIPDRVKRRQHPGVCEICDSLKEIRDGSE